MNFSSCDLTSCNEICKTLKDNISSAMNISSLQHWKTFDSTYRSKFTLSWVKNVRFHQGLSMLFCF